MKSSIESPRLALCVILVAVLATGRSAFGQQPAAPSEDQRAGQAVTPLPANNGRSVALDAPSSDRIRQEDMNAWKLSPTGLRITVIAGGALLGVGLGFTVAGATVLSQGRLCYEFECLKAPALLGFGLGGFALSGSLMLGLGLRGMYHHRDRTIQAARVQAGLSPLPPLTPAEAERRVFSGKVMLIFGGVFTAMGVIGTTMGTLYLARYSPLSHNDTLGGMLLCFSPPAIVSGVVMLGVGGYRMVHYGRLKGDRSRSQLSLRLSPSAHSGGMGVLALGEF